MNLCANGTDGKKVATMYFIKRWKTPHGCCKCSSEDQYMDDDTQQCVSKQACQPPSSGSVESNDMPAYMSLNLLNEFIALCAWPRQSRAIPENLCTKAGGSLQASERLPGNEVYYAIRTKVCIPSQYASGRKRAIDSFKHYYDIQCCQCSDANLYFDATSVPMRCVTKEACEARMSIQHSA